MNTKSGLKRFIDAQQSDYANALAEIKQGRKVTHWMWYIFPQIQGLGFSETSKYYAIKDAREAEDFLKHPVLGERLIEISGELLNLESHDARAIFGSPDDMKLKSSMTLFASLPKSNPVFEKVLDRFFNGGKDGRTLELMGRQS
ncbi:MAG TPA: DUF1810 domain-containing protein [Puia sp.]|nr:DUF1810 domain-containing protein [Puia sp.]